MGAGGQTIVSIDNTVRQSSTRLWVIIDHYGTIVDRIRNHRKEPATTNNSHRSYQTVVVIVVVGTVI